MQNSGEQSHPCCCNFLILYQTFDSCHSFNLTLLRNIETKYVNKPLFDRNVRTGSTATSGSQQSYGHLELGILL